MILFKNVLLWFFLLSIGACSSPSTWEYAPPNIAQAGYTQHLLLPAQRHNYFTLDQIFAVKPSYRQPAELWLNFTAHNNERKNIKPLQLSYTVKLDPLSGRVISSTAKHPQFKNSQPYPNALIAAYRRGRSYAMPKTMYYEPSFSASQIGHYLHREKTNAAARAAKQGIVFRGQPFMILENMLLTRSEKNRIYAYRLAPKYHALVSTQR